MIDKRLRLREKQKNKHYTSQNSHQLSLIQQSNEFKCEQIKRITQDQSRTSAQMLRPITTLRLVNSNKSIKGHAEHIKEPQHLMWISKRLLFNSSTDFHSNIQTGMHSNSQRITYNKYVINLWVGAKETDP